MAAKAAKAAAGLTPVPEADSRHQAAMADVEARLALDAAANLEIDQLKGALNYSPEEAEEAERMRAAVSKLSRSRGQTGFNMFLIRAPLLPLLFVAGGCAAVGFGVGWTLCMGWLCMDGAGWAPLSAVQCRQPPPSPLCCWAMDSDGMAACMQFNMQILPAVAFLGAMRTCACAQLGAKPAA